MSRLTTISLIALAVGAITLAHIAQWIHPALTVSFYGLLFAPYFFLLYTAHKSPIIALSPRLILGTAVAIRIGLALATPYLSDDLYRYVWDGRVAWSGVNPFAYAPVDLALEGLRDQAIWPNINHPTLPTIYPPMAQYLFWFNALLGGGLICLRLLFVGVELAAGYYIWRKVRHIWDKRRQVFALLIYALNPLIMLEVAWSGHVDVLAWALLCMALVCFTTTQSMRSHVETGVLLGLSISAKFLGLMALPVLVLAPLAQSIGHPKSALRRVIMLGVCLGVFACSYGPYIGLGSGVFGSLGKYAKSWKTNDSVFRVVNLGSQATIKTMAPKSMRLKPEDPNSQVIFRLSKLDDMFMKRGWTKQWEGKTIPNTSFLGHEISETLGKLVAMYAMGFLLLWCLIVIREPITSVGLLFLALYLVAPTVMPWYVAWLVPLAVLRSGRSGTMIAYSALVILAYSAWVRVKMGGPWEVPHVLIAVEFGALAIVAWFTSKTSVPAWKESQPHHPHAQSTIEGENP